MTQIPLMTAPSERSIGLLFQALANPTRLKIVNFLAGMKEGSSVSGISAALGLEQTQSSHALRCLTFCGLVLSRREGRSIFYSLNQKSVIPVLVAAERHVGKYATNLYTCDTLER